MPEISSTVAVLFLSADIQEIIENTKGNEKTCVVVIGLRKLRGL